MSLTKSKSFHFGTVKKSVVIMTRKEKVWDEISNIVGLDSWVIDVKKVIFLSKIKRGKAAIRKITFQDGNEIEEHVVGWKNGEYFSYIAVGGLPLRSYHATLSVKSQDRKKSLLTWQSYFESNFMTKKEFHEFVSFMEIFYRDSLKNLKSLLEK